MARAVIALVVVALFFLSGIGVFSTAYEAGADKQTKVNETFTPPNSTEAPEYISVNESTATGTDYGDSVTVRDENDTIMDGGGSDYSWFSTNGTLKVPSGSRLINDSNGTVTYDYYTRTETQRKQFALITNLTEIAVPLVFILGVVVLLATLRSLG